MATPLTLPSYPTPLSLVWRAVSTLSLVRRLLRIPEERTAQASAADELDTSLTQAHLEVLK